MARKKYYDLLTGKGELPPYDRAQLAFYHMMKGDITTAFQATYDPASLGPLQQVSFQEQLHEELFDQEVEQRGLIPTMKRIVTNPMVWMGVMAMAIPLGGKGALQRYRRKAGDYMRSMGPLERFMAPGIEALRDKKGGMTRMGRLLRDVEGRLEVKQEEMFESLGRSIRAYEGKTGTALSELSAVKIGAMLEQPWNPKSPAYAQWERLRRQTRSNIGFRGPVSLTEAERGVFDSMDQVRRKFKTEIIDPLGSDKKLTRALQEAGILDVAGVRSIPVEFYMPRMLKTDTGRLSGEVVQALQENRFEDAISMTNPLNQIRQTYEKYLKEGVIGRTPGSLRERTYELLPSPAHLRLLEPQLVPGTVSEVEKVLAGTYPSLHPRKMYGEFSLDASRSLPRYMDRMARFSAYEASGLSQKVAEELSVVRRQNPALAHYTETVLVPTLTGKLTPREFVRANWWETAKQSWIKTLNDPKVRALPGGKQASDFLTKSLIGGRLSSAAGVDTAMASYLYQSTLGGNLGSAFTNMMQTLSTTMPVLGPKATMKGMWQTLKRLQQYGRHRAAGMDGAMAYEKAFAPYIDAGLHLSADFGDVAFRRMVEQSWQQASRHPLAKKWLEGGKTALMLPFRMAEGFNRMVAFDAGLAAAKAEGVVGKEAVGFAKEIVGETQFLGGALMTPMGVREWPRVIRQFTQFGLRSTNLYWQAIKRGDRDTLRMLGLLVGGGAAAKEVGKGVGLDVSQGLPGNYLVEAMRGNELTGGIPFVAPFPQFALALGHGAMAGDWQPMRRMLPLLAPGGLAASRAVTMWGGEAGEWTGQMLGKKYVDYNQRTADGRFGMFKPNGQLVGYYTPQQMMMLAAGLKPDDMAQEEAYAQWLRKQAQVTHELRRQYMLGMYKNDMDAVQKAQTEYKRLYGKPLRLKPSDVRALEDRRQILRTQLLMQQLPVELRGKFLDAARGAMVERLGPVAAMPAPPMSGFGG